MARPPAQDDDDLPWLAEGVREERSTLVPRARLFGGGLIAVLLAVLVGIGVYLASGHKSDGSSGYARPEDAPLIAADAGAYKVAPADPGGAQITGLDETMAATASGRDLGSAILPDASEEPLARPLPGAAPAPAIPPTDLLPAILPPVVPAPPATRPIVAAPVVAPVPPPKAASKAEPVKPTPTADAPAKTTAKVEPKAKPHDADPLAAPPAKPADPAVRAAKFDPAKPDPAPPKPVKVDAAKPDAAAAEPPSAKRVSLQLGAFSTRDKAEAAWTTAGGGGALAGLAKQIEPVDRDGTTLYRLRAGGVPSKAAATALCVRVKAAGNACIVAG